MSDTSFHIVSGDALAYSLAQCGVEGEVIICRECLIEGPLDEFLAVRGRFLRDAYNATDYTAMAAAEFRKMPLIPSGSEINLWFGNDLFCQANMWFVADLIADGVNVFRVFPFEKGEAAIDFASGDCGDISESLKMKIEFAKSDLTLARDLWQAYKSGDLNTLAQLSNSDSACFQWLEEA
jgi:hypothetical protein